MSQRRSVSTWSNWNHDPNRGTPSTTGSNPATIAPRGRAESAAVPGGSPPQSRAALSIVSRGLSLLDRDPAWLNRHPHAAPPGGGSLGIRDPALARVGDGHAAGHGRAVSAGAVRGARSLSLGAARRGREQRDPPTQGLVSECPLFCDPSGRILCGLDGPGLLSQQVVVGPGANDGQRPNP